MNPQIPENNSQLFDTAVFNAQIPKEGPKGISLVVPFTSRNVAFDANLLLTMSQQYVSQIQGVFADNSASDVDLLFTISVINQGLRFPPGTQGYIPLFVPKNATITISSSGELSIPIIFYNIPMPAFIWPAIAAFSLD